MVEEDNIMLEEIYNLYKRNFPNNVRNYDTIMNILSNKDNYIITRKDNNKLFGISIINKNTIILLCVDKEYRNKGYGTSLLKESEEYILNNGYDKLNIGEGFDYITPGVPMNDVNNNFFKKNGYVNSWGDDECFDMDMNLSDINYDESINDVIDEVLYKIAGINDIKEIEKCVLDAEPKFTEYYKPECYYKEGSNQRVLVAVKDNKVVGTLMICIETEGKDIGSVGCTTTKTSYRHKGIATNMVKIGTKYLQSIGLKHGHLGYTYTGLDKMYGKAGYKVTTKYLMAEKDLVKTLKKN